MSRHDDVAMMVRGGSCEVSLESYEYYMSNRGCGFYEMECERRGRSQSGSGSVVDERGEPRWELSRGGSGGRVRSRSPRPYHAVSRRGDVVDMEVVHRRKNTGKVRSRSPRPYLEQARRGDVVDMEVGHRHKSSPPPLGSKEKYVAEETISPSFKGLHKYGYPTLEGGPGKCITLERNMKAASDDYSLVQKSFEIERMVRSHQDVQPDTSSGETSRHYHSGTTNRTVDKKDLYENHSSSERAPILGAYHEDNPPLCSRDMLYTACSNSQKNNYGRISPAYRDGRHIFSCCQGVPHMNSYDLHGIRSKVSEKYAVDAYEGHRPNNPTLGLTSHLKSTHDPLHSLNFHYPIDKEGENGELRYPSDARTRYIDVHAGFIETHSQRASGISREANRFLSDEEYGVLCQHSRKDCYDACLPLNVTNKTADNYISDCSRSDFHPSQRVSHDRNIHPDPNSPFSHPENQLHGVIAYDPKDPHFLTPFNYEPGRVASGNSVERYHNHEETINFIDSGADLVYNTEDTRGDIPESILGRYVVHNKQDGEQYGEQYYYGTRTSEPLDRYADSGMYNTEISREIKQYDQFIEYPPPEREWHRDGRDRYNDAQRERINTKLGSVYDVNITSECDMVIGRLDTNKQRWVEEDLQFRGASSGILEMKSVSSNRSNVLNTRTGSSHGNSGSSRYLPARNAILLEEDMDIYQPETTGLDRTRRRGSRSIFDRLGSPQGSINQSPPRLIQRRFNSHKPEHRQSKVRTKSNHPTLNGSPHLNKGRSYYKQCKNSSTITDEDNMNLAKDPNTLEDLDIPFNCDNKTEDFKQAVQKAFLLISLKMNENLATRRRYQGQGKAGTLFCIICKRSNSKEFRDARALAAHSLMCQKSGIRAQHLGLFKAICVTMGWNSDIHEETGMWTPQVLPEAKALAQKEDLICWPPVFIFHTVTSLGKDSSAHKVLTTEELEAFFRSKGFITGRVKMCRINNRIMLVKFLGTFSGLTDAEKLCKYYAEKNRGREAFQKLTCAYIKDSQACEAVLPIDKAELPDLYGYMGIAEDWDKLDTESKKRCTIKSKQEILAFSAEPILPGGG